MVSGSLEDRSAIHWLLWELTSFKVTTVVTFSRPDLEWHIDIIWSWFRKDNKCTWSVLRTDSKEVIGKSFAPEVQSGGTLYLVNWFIVIVIVYFALKQWCPFEVKLAAGGTAVLGAITTGQNGFAVQIKTSAAHWELPPMENVALQMTTKESLVAFARHNSLHAIRTDWQNSARGNLSAYLTNSSIPVSVILRWTAFQELFSL